MNEQEKRELFEFLKEAELKKSSLDLATELFKTRSKIFCTGLIVHLTMYVAGEY